MLSSPAAFKLLVRLAKKEPSLEIRAEAISALGDTGRKDALVTLRGILEKENHQEIWDEALSALADHRQEFDYVVTVAQKHRDPRNPPRGPFSSGGYGCRTGVPHFSSKSSTHHGRRNGLPKPFRFWKTSPGRFHYLFCSR